MFVRFRTVILKGTCTIIYYATADYYIGGVSCIVFLDVHHLVFEECRHLANC